MYRLEFSTQAYIDMQELSDTIMYIYKMPKTAEKYMRGLRMTIGQLKQNAETFSVRYNESLQQYGSNVRRVNYKKMTVIYTVHGELVYIHRIVPASLIKGL